jgi:Na+/H+-dicarboxylate symporter
VFTLAGLVGGLAAGVWLSFAGEPLSGWVVGIAQPIGMVFINAIRMTVIPLIVAKLIVSVASASDERALKRIGGGAVVLFVGTVVVAATFGASAARLALPHLHLDSGVASLLQGGGAADSSPATGAARELPNLGQWLVGLVPPNPFKAASDGTLLPLIVFALSLGCALSRVNEIARAAVVAMLQGVADAMIVIVRWVLRFAPLGVLALALPLAARLGLGAAEALAFYVALVAVTCVAFALLVLYPAAVFFGGVPLGRFARACVPAQVIAFSSRSSLASLPVMIEQGRDALRLPEVVTAFFMPVAAAMFRGGSAIGTTIGALFLAHLYGVVLTPPEVATVVVTAVVTMFGSPGVPSGAVIVIVPILASAGVPVEGIGILLGVDTLPDMFRTTTNITANMSAATIVSRFAGREVV